jgi:hypothetical protein
MGETAESLIAYRARPVWAGGCHPADAAQMSGILSFNLEADGSEPAHYGH